MMKWLLLNFSTEHYSTKAVLNKPTVLNQSVHLWGTIENKNILLWNGCHKLNCLVNVCLQTPFKRTYDATHTHTHKMWGSFKAEKRKIKISYIHPPLPPLPAKNTYKTKIRRYLSMTRSTQNYLVHFIVLFKTIFNIKFLFLFLLPQNPCQVSVTC